MRFVTLAVGVSLVAACQSAPPMRQFTGVAEADALDCVNDQLKTKGYEIVAGGETARATRAERLNNEPWMLNAVGISDSADIVDASAQGDRLTLTASSQVIRQGERLSTPPSDEARRHAQQAFIACTA